MTEKAYFDGKRVMHIDTSGKLHENKNTGIAYKIVDSKEHKGLALKGTLKKELRKKLKLNRDYAKLYAICIYSLIKENLDSFDILVICEDEDFSKVKEYLNILFKNNKDYLSKEIISLIMLRKLTGDEKLRSYADGMARSYRRRALKQLAKRQEGISLNPIKINYLDIKLLLEKIKNEVSGG